MAERAAAGAGPVGRLLGRATGWAARWVRVHVPTRETLGQNRWLRPFAAELAQGALWRLNRRSVPRAVALGFFVAIIVPAGHMLMAAIAAIVLRANIVVAVASTWINNPLTLIPIWIGAWRIGHFLLHDWRLAYALRAAGLIAPAGHRHFHYHLGPRMQLGLATGMGLLVEALAAAVLGYVVTSLVWRWRVGQRRQRSQTAQDRP